MIRCYILLLLVLSSPFPFLAFAEAISARDSSTTDIFPSDIFATPLRVRQAKELFDARRFRDAELVFEILRAEHLPVQPRNLDSYLNVLDYLARSISEQGKTDNVLSLLQERHVLVARSYDSRGFVFASSMSRLAEAMYREGRRSSALNFIDYAISVYENLRPVPDDALSQARSNRLQYKVAQFSTAMLPMDLSDFYTRCELLNSGQAARSTNHLMSAYVEVGVDYIPEGEWVDYFDMLAQQRIPKGSDPAKNRIFLPHSSERMRADLCVVTESDAPGKLISAESGVD